jgi:NAD(P)-dependent dehydrogenase (short-subunit alcohol dehydrogenase family)
MGKLEGKIALITGGNSGIGLATARLFVNEGAYVFITGRRDPELATAVKEIGRNTKAAVRSFARTWTTDLKDRRSRVNAVSPGSIDTPGLNDLLASSETGQQRLKMIRNAVPLARLGTPDEIAKAVLFLASDDNSYITGAELFVDGGMGQV